MTKVEHPLEECIGMFHRRSDLRHPDISTYALNRKWMSPYGSIHRTICSPVFRAEISLVPVTYDSGRTEIYLRIMHIGRRYWKLLNDLDLNDKSMCLVAVMLLIILCRRWSILDLRVFASSSRGLPYSPLSASMRDASFMVPFLMRILLAIIRSLTIVHGNTRLCSDQVISQGIPGSSWMRCDPWSPFPHEDPIGCTIAAIIESSP